MYTSHLLAKCNQIRFEARQMSVNRTNQLTPFYILPRLTCLGFNLHLSNVITVMVRWYRVINRRRLSRMSQRGGMTTDIYSLKHIDKRVCISRQ